jgi:outer membrane protein OmpA-like peptidoglycan-associated protein
VQSSTCTTIFLRLFKRRFFTVSTDLIPMINRSAILLCAVVFTILCNPLIGRAQDPLLRPSLYVEGFGGASKYFGEFTDISFWIAGGLNAWYRINPQFSVGGSIAIGQTRFRVVNDAKLYYSGTPQVLARVTPIDALVRWNIMPYEATTPYLTLGAGLVSFEVQSDIGEYIDFRKVNPAMETQEIIQRNTSLTNVFQFNAGVGYEYILNRNVTVGVFARMYFPSTDLLDGIQYEASGNDAFLLTGFTGSFGITSVTGMADADGDGIPDQVEESLGTKSDVADSDGDGLNDFDELKYHTNPDAKDTDGDGLSDRDEIELFKTNSLSTDSDTDGLDDGGEVAQTTDPLKPDTDGDGFSDAAEITLGLNPVRPDAATSDLLSATEEKVIGNTRVRVPKINAGATADLKNEVSQLQNELAHQKALLKVAENRPAQPVQSSRKSNTVDVSAYQRRIDSLQYILAMAENCPSSITTIRDTIFKDREIVREIPREVLKTDTIFKTKEIVREVPKEVIKEVLKRDTIRIAGEPQRITVRDTVFKDREVVREIPREIVKTDTVFKTKEIVREVPKEVIKEVFKTDTIRISTPQKVTIRDTVFKDREVVREIPKEIVKEIVKRDTVIQTREIIRRDTVTLAAEPLKILIRDTVFKTSPDIAANYPAGPPTLGSVQFTPKPIYFAPNSTELGLEADESIAYVVKFMREYPESIIEISGYADSVGTPEANKIVTQRRTGAVAQQLMQAGVDPTRLVERAYGNITATIQDPKERRVEFKLLKLVRF